jgi:hypothetical protein
MITLIIFIRGCETTANQVNEDFPQMSCGPGSNLWCCERLIFRGVRNFHPTDAECSHDFDSMKALCLVLPTGLWRFGPRLDKLSRPQHKMILCWMISQMPLTAVEALRYWMENLGGEGSGCTGDAFLGGGGYDCI